MDWLRWHHGTVADPKFSIIAKRSGQCRGLVLACWSMILEYASTREDRGSVSGLDLEELAIVVDIELDQAEAIYSAMIEKGLIGEDHKLCNWNKRQPKRENDHTAAERVARWRDKKKNENSDIDISNVDVTQCNASVTPATDKNREEQRREETIKPSPENSPAELSASLKTSKPKKTTTGDPRHAWLSRWWCWSFENVTGSKYAYGKEDAGILATLLKKIDFAQTMERACCYLLMTDDQRFPRGAPTLKGLQHQINQLAGSFTDTTETKALAYRIVPPKGTPLQNYRPWEA